MDAMHRQPHILLISRPGVIPCVSDPVGSGFGLITTNLSDLKVDCCSCATAHYNELLFWRPSDCGLKVSEGTQSFAQVWLFVVLLRKLTIL